jgi:hypothetical protein
MTKRPAPSRAKQSESADPTDDIDTSTPALIRAIAEAKSTDELDLIWKAMRRVGFSPEGLMGQRLHTRMQELR